MFKNISNYFNKKSLKDKKYSFLFDKTIQNEYVCFDCETTGLNPKIDDIISIGAVIIKNNTIVSSKKFVRYIKPKNSSLDEKSIKIHHIRECDLKNACEIEDVILEFLEFIENRTLVGYFLNFDKNMINKYLKPMIGVTLPNRSIEVSEIYHDFKIELIPQSFVDLKFNSILKDLEIPQFGNHDSFNDAIMTAMIFLKLKNHPSVKIK
ncbi:DNA polymerase III subunit epsilon [Aliarcobacter cryaerophilus ATCC 43158]|uniref:DNA polymerase III, epsilon subunit n=1 Tax=Aliarcobacter cryaerophilus ATCC 43158 TaxID=1032070 RepID=A0AAD0TU91_9BACT|nr:3'-5' exonuclease [Aliarcobacter cryaerophilus]AYJ80598.1 DNA polymerase III, epsilon subunit [Aliarcobacter cryaerophilus ATCC 43158]PRM99297.1 DNA polymerase III subunit epsilon [Aliarcobacter cryaerophilus]QCZ22932.1 DNA polymerase III subunit epsilon [Aliarcobacter cryaerophilus ATCC 43158]